MENTWKDLKRKYKFRRVLLIAISALLVLSIGWFAGRGFTKIGYADDINIESEKILGQIGESGEGTPDISEKVAEPLETEKPKRIQEEFWELVLVSETNPLTEDYPVELERISDGIYVDERIVVPLKQMVAQAKSDGINLEVVAGYESFESQTKKYEDKIEEFKTQGFTQYEAEKDAKLLVPEVGNAEYHTGLAVDILSPDYTKQGLDDLSFEKSSAFDWLLENSGEYGFILRFPEGKESMTKSDYAPWHFRFVGKQVAEEIWEKEYCLEEYLFLKDRSTIKTDTFMVELEEPEVNVNKEEDNKEIKTEIKTDINTENKIKSEVPSAEKTKPIEAVTRVESSEEKAETMQVAPDTQITVEETEQAEEPSAKKETTQKQPEIASEAVSKEDIPKETEKIRVVTNKDMAPKPKTEVVEEKVKVKATNDFGEVLDSSVAVGVKTANANAATETVDNPNAFAKG